MYNSKLKGLLPVAHVWFQLINFSFNAFLLRHRIWYPVKQFACMSVCFLRFGSITQWTRNDFTVVDVLESIIYTVACVKINMFRIYCTNWNNKIYLLVNKASWYHLLRVAFLHSFSFLFFSLFYFRPFHSVFYDFYFFYWKCLIYDCRKKMKIAFRIGWKQNIRKNLVRCWYEANDESIAQMLSLWLVIPICVVTLLGSVEYKFSLYYWLSKLRSC